MRCLFKTKEISSAKYLLCCYTESEAGIIKSFYYKTKKENIFMYFLLCSQPFLLEMIFFI